MKDNHGTTTIADLSVIEDKSLSGSGRCKACGCRGYRHNTPKNDYCKDCGHSWYMHEGAG